MTFFFLWMVCAIVSAIIASSRGRSGFNWFLIGCCLGIFAIILAAVLPSLKSAPVIVGGERATFATHTRCPACKGLVHREATLCMHCRTALTPEPFVPEPETPPVVPVMPAPEHWKEHDANKSRSTTLVLIICGVLLGATILLAAYSQRPRPKVPDDLKGWPPAEERPLTFKSMDQLRQEAIDRDEHK